MFLTAFRISFSVETSAVSTNSQIPLFPTLSQANPEIETIRNLTNSYYLGNPSLSRGLNGSIFVAWREEEVQNDIDIFVAERTSKGTWITEKVMDIAGGDCEPHIVVDMNGTPHLVWRNTDGLATVKYAMKSGTGWLVETLSDTTSDSYYGAVCIDNQNHPHVSWVTGDRFSGYTLYHSEKISGIWSTQTIASSNDELQYPSLIVDPEGQIYLFWKEKYGGSGNQLAYILFNGTEWSNPIRIASGQIIYKYDVTHAHLSNPVIALERIAGSGKWNIETWTIANSNWQMTILDSPFEENHYPSIGVDPWGNLCIQWIAYFNPDVGDSITYWMIGRKSNNEWTFHKLASENSSDFSFENSEKSTLFVDEKGVIHAIMSKRITLVQSNYYLDYCQVDIIPPEVMIISPENMIYYEPCVLQYTSWENDEIINISMYLNDIFTDFPNNSVLSNLSDGYYHLKMEIEDVWGNIGYDEIYFSRKTAYTGFFHWNATIYPVESFATVMLIDPDLNVNSSLRETVNVSVYSNSDAVGITVTLCEHHSNSNDFLGIVQFRDGASNEGYDIIQVLEGDSVTVEYLDRENARGEQEVVITTVLIKNLPDGSISTTPESNTSSSTTTSSKSSDFSVAYESFPTDTSVYGFSVGIVSLGLAVLVIIQRRKKE